MLDQTYKRYNKVMRNAEWNGGNDVIWEIAEIEVEAMEWLFITKDNKERLFSEYSGLWLCA